jgi:vacuolar-type H+-ATPase subunit H
MITPDFGQTNALLDYRSHLVGLKLFVPPMELMREGSQAEGVHLSSPEIMNKIVEAEKESRQILDQTNKEISELKRDVPNKIASMRQDILQKATKRRESALAEAEKTGVEEAKRIALESKKQLDSISQIPSAKRRQAVDKAIELLLS